MRPGAESSCSLDTAETGAAIGSAAALPNRERAREIAEEGWYYWRSQHGALSRSLCAAGGIDDGGDERVGGGGGVVLAVLRQSSHEGGRTREWVALRLLRQAGNR